MTYAAAQLLLFIAIQAFIAFACWRVVRARAPDLPAADRLLCAGVLYFAQIVGISLLLGWLGVLMRGPLVVLNLLCSVFALLRSSAGVPAREGRAAPLSGRRGGTQALLRIGNLVLLALLAILMARVFLRGAVMAPSEWDGLHYHLPMSALMMQTHQLALGPVHNPVIEAYPKNIEIWFHWILSFFGDDRWVDLGQVPFLALAMLATYCMARRLGAAPAASTAGMLLLPFSPVVIAQLTTAYTDVALSALVLAAMALVLVLAAHASPVLLVSLGCALGLLAGTKFSALAFVALILGAAAFVTARTRGWRALPALAPVVLLVLLLGGDAYIRNWRLHGNPVYPYRTTILNLDLPGPRAPDQVYGIAQTRDLHPVTRVVRSWCAVDVIGHSEIFGGFGVMWPFLAAASVLSLAAAIHARDAPRLAVFVLFTALFLMTPLNFRVRFVIYLLGLGCVSFSHVVDRAAAPVRAVCLALALAVAAFSAYQVLRKDQSALAQRGVSEVKVRGDACSRAEPPPFRPAYDWLRRHAPAGSTVVVFRSDEVLMPYCLWNPRFSNRVEFADAASTTPLHDIARQRPHTILFLPHGSRAYARYVAEESTRLRPLLTTDGVTLAGAADGS